MKRFILSFALLLGFFQLSFASPGTDLLEKGRKMYKACYLDVRNDFTKAQAVLEQAYELLMKEDNIADAAEALYLIGDIIYLSGEKPILSEEYFSLAKDMSKEKNLRIYILSSNGLAKLRSLNFDIDSYAEAAFSIDTDSLETVLSAFEITRGLCDLGRALRRFNTMAEFSVYESGRDLFWDSKDTLAKIEEITFLSDFALTLAEKGHLHSVLYSALVEDRYDELGCWYSVDSPRILYNIGRCYFFYGKNMALTEEDSDHLFKKTESYLKSSRDLSYEFLGPKNKLGKEAESALGELYLAKGEYYQASRIFEAIVQNKEYSTKSDALDAANNMAFYAESLSGLGKDSLAMPLAIDAAKLSLSIVAESKSLNVDSKPYEVVGEISLKTNDHIRSAYSANVILFLLKNEIILTLSNATKLERENLWRSKWNNIVNNILSYSSNLFDDQGVFYNAALLSKDYLMAYQESIEKYIAGSSNKELKRDYEELKNLQQKYLRWNDEKTDIMAKELSRIRSLETRIKEAGALNEDFARIIDFSFSQIADCLSPNEAAIEFVSYANPDGKKHYVASILRPGQVPKNISLGIDDTFTEKIPNDFIYNNEDYLLFNQLLFYLKDVDTIYFSPSGIYSSIAIENLLMSDGKRLSERFNMVRLSSTREILRLKQEKPAKWTSAVLYGGLNYNTSAENKEYYAEQATSRGISDEQHWGYLPGTLNEVSSIKKLFKNVPCEVYTDDAGVEETFKSLSDKAPSVIHIATHGAYDKDLVSKSMSSFWVEENDMLKKCYLVFSGANTPLPGRDDLDDGLLTALEISQMDLRGTDLVVLSACGTGLNIRNYNESYGLLQGFKKAGCKSVLMTLWDVDDAATEMFMTNFYRSRLSGLDNHTSLEKAKAAVRSTYPDPKYWAGFILID